MARDGVTVINKSSSTCCACPTTSSTSSHLKSSRHRTSVHPLLRCYCYTLCLLSIIFTLNSLSIGVQATDEYIKWPKAIDQHDQTLIDLAQSSLRLHHHHRDRRDADPDADADVDVDSVEPNAAATATAVSPAVTSTDDSSISDTSSSSSSSVPPKVTGTESGKNKSSKIDWDEVEKHWQATTTEEDMAKKFNEMENGAKNGVRSLLRSLFPRIVAMSSDAKVSGNCSAGILKWIISLRHLKGWAIRMLDAIGKPPSGILEGAITMFGNHKQCLDLRAPDDEDDFDDDEELTAPRKVKEFFRGQYCSLEIKPWLPPKPRFYGFSSKIEALKRDPSDDSLFGELSELAIFMHLAPLRFDLCVPSLCTRDDLQRVSSFLGSKLDLKVKVSRCEVYSDSFTLPSTIQILAILAFMGAIGIVSLCTTLMIFLPIVRKGHGTPLLVRCLSLQSSWKEWTGLEAYEKKPKIATLYGLRWVLLMWIILTETINVINYNFFRDVLRLKDVIISQAAQIVTNSSLQYSSLIFLSAFIFGYTNDNKGAWKGIKFVVKKYFRFMPVIFAGIGFMMLLPLIQTPWIQGPTWADYMINRTETCQSYWYRSIFFLQNFYHPSNVCLPHTWILCVELQLALVFTVLIGFVSKLRAKGKNAASIIFLAFIAMIGFAINFAQVYLNQLPPTWLWTLPDRDQRNDYFFIHLYKPWTHISVYAIGVAAGILCAQRKRKATGANNNNNNLPSVQSSSPYGTSVILAMGWAFIAIVTGLIIFYPHDWVLGNLPAPIISGFYDGFHRIAWAITHVILMYFIVRDIESQSSILQFILGNKIFISFGRLSLSAFVVHPIILLLFFATQWTHLFSGLFVMLYFVIGTIALTYGLAFFVAMWFEYPASSLFNSRDSTAVEKDPRLLTQSPRSPVTDDFSTFKSSIDKFTTGANGASANGDIEMSKKQQEQQHAQRQQETAQIRL